MRPAADFWFSLAHLARLIDHAPGEPAERRCRVMSEFARLGPLGRQTALCELQSVVRELSYLEANLHCPSHAASNGQPSAEHQSAQSEEVSEALPRAGDQP